jgi:glycosyltransferase involved in cell wall biosynthesis
MKITFVLPSVKLGGGVRVVFEHANRLQERGHDVSIVYSILPLGLSVKKHKTHYLFRGISTFIKNITRKNRVEWFDLKCRLIKAPILFESYIPPADIIVATWWKTAYYVHRYSRKRGEKFYLIQHYEIWGGPKNKVEKTYKLGFHNIVISSWLKNIIEGLGAKVEAIIPDGVDLNKFYPEKVERNEDQIRILTPYRLAEWKGVNDALKVYEIVKARGYKNVKLVMFGESPNKSELPHDVEFHLTPSDEELRKIYNSCDIFLFTSLQEGFGLPPMEAMACKVPVVTTKVGAVPDYTIPGRTALVSPPGDIESLANNVIELIENEKKGIE